MRGRALNHGDVDAGLGKRGADVVRRIVRADHGDFLALHSVWPGVLGRMLLNAFKHLLALDVRHVGFGRHAGCEHKLTRLERDFFAVALDHHSPGAAGLVITGPARLGRAPEVEFHHARIHLKPVADLVLGREDRPVAREFDIRQVVVPDRVVQAQRLVAFAPGVARPFVLFDNERRHAELTKPRAEGDAALPATDDEHIRLRVDAERGEFVFALFLPGRLALVVAVFGAQRARLAERFFVALELIHRGEQCPDQTVLDTHEAGPARNRRLEHDPRFDDAVGLGRRLALVECPVVGFGAVQAVRKHVANIALAFGCRDVPGEREHVAPVAFTGEQLERGVDIALGECLVEAVEHAVGLRGRCGVEHETPPCLLLCTGAVPPSSSNDPFFG